MTSNKLSLNVSKTKCMVLGTSQRLANVDFPEVVCNGEIVDKVDNFKYLGIFLDNRLHFNIHADYVKRKIFSKMKMLAKTRQFISQNMSLQLFQSLILPHLDYGDIIYDAMGSQDAAKLQTVQNKCLRICLNAEPRSSAKQLHEQANFPLLSDRRKIHTSKFVYNGLHSRASDNVNNMFTFVNETHVVNTRASTESVASVPHVNLQISKGNVAYRGPKYFNELPTDVRTAPSHKSFNSRAKKWLA